MARSSVERCCRSSKSLQMIDAFTLRQVIEKGSKGKKKLLSARGVCSLLSSLSSSAGGISTSVGFRVGHCDQTNEDWEAEMTLDLKQSCKPIFSSNVRGPDKFPRHRVKLEAHSQREGGRPTTAHQILLDPATQTPLQHLSSCPAVEAFTAEHG